jgi:hypothetical protein
MGETHAVVVAIEAYQQKGIKSVERIRAQKDNGTG